MGRQCRAIDEIRDVAFSFCGNADAKFFLLWQTIIWKRKWRSTRGAKG